MLYTDPIHGSILSIMFFVLLLFIVVLHHLVWKPFRQLAEIYTKKRYTLTRFRGFQTFF